MNLKYVERMRQALYNLCDEHDRLVEAARGVVTDAARYTDDGVPVSRSARALYDVLEEM